MNKFKETIVYFVLRRWWDFCIWRYNCKVRFFNLRKEGRSLLKELKEEAKNG